VQYFKIGTVILAILWVVNINKVYAQDSTARVSIKLSPQHLIPNIFRLEAEYLLNQKHGIAIAPLLQFKSIGHKDDNIFGFGLELLHKIYLKKDAKAFDNIYFGYGLNYSHYNTKFRYFGWVNTLDPDGLQILRYQQIEQEGAIDRLGGFVMIGYQDVIEKVIILDLYLGYGTIKSYSSNSATNKRYDQNLLDLSYSGVSPRVGMKMGIIF